MLKLLQWYHTALQHPGTKCMQATLQENFYRPGVNATIESFICTCDICQTCKLIIVKKYGKIPLPSNNKIASWEQVHVDLIGPWDVHYNPSSVPGKGTIQKIQALTMIDKATGSELAGIHNKTSCCIAVQVFATHGFVLVLCLAGSVQSIFMSIVDHMEVNLVIHGRVDCKGLE